MPICNKCKKEWTIEDLALREDYQDRLVYETFDIWDCPECELKMKSGDYFICDECSKLHHIDDIIVYNKSLYVTEKIILHKLNKKGE